MQDKRNVTHETKISYDEPKLKIINVSAMDVITASPNDAAPNDDATVNFIPWDEGWN